MRRCCLDRGRSWADISGAGRTQHTYLVIHNQRIPSMWRIFWEDLGQSYLHVYLSTKKVELVTSLSAEMLHMCSPHNHTMRVSNCLLFVQLLLGLLGGWVNSDPVPLFLDRWLIVLQRNLLVFTDRFYALMVPLRASVIQMRSTNQNMNCFSWQHQIQATNENNNECKPFNSSAPIYYNIAFCGKNDAFMKLAW